MRHQFHDHFATLLVCSSLASCQIPYWRVAFADDQCYGMIKWKQAAMGLQDFGLTLRNPDFVKLAEVWLRKRQPSYDSLEKGIAYRLRTPSS
jgi:hypothetical protein